MKRIPQSQLTTLKLLTQFGDLTKEKLELFKKRDISGLKKRRYLKEIKIIGNYFVSSNGFNIIERYNKRNPEAPISLRLNGNGNRHFKTNLELDSKRTSMAKLLVRCPQCHKIAQVENEKKVFTKIFKTYSCGHSVVETPIQIPENRDEIWLKLRPYQQEGVKKMEESGINFLLADDMGVGKTPQTLALMRYHFDELTPTICVVKSSLKYQWAVHYMDWAVKHNGEFPLDYLPYIITDGKMPVLPNFKFYIIGMDLLSKKWKDLAAINPKFLIVDECHHFKNDGSARTIALSKLIKNSPELKHKVFTSGTPILNRATEFFVTLNLIRPDEWPSRLGFYRNYCTQNEKGQYDRIASWAKERFQQKIAPYFLRREKREILKDLPPFQRNFRWIDIEDETIKNSYNRELDVMKNWYNNQIKETGKVDAMSLLAYLTKLRQITGIAKIQTCVEDTLDFLEFAQPESGDKIAIGVHHKAVMQGLKISFENKGYEVVTISGEDNAEAKLEKEQEFKKPGKHILIASMLAAGEGLNLQYCNVVTVLERQWNAAKEVQYEGRFDRFGQTRPVITDYFVAKGTIDEWFTEKVEYKRKNCAEAMGDELSLENDMNSLIEVAEKTMNNRL